MKQSLNLDTLLTDGFTKKLAVQYLAKLEVECNTTTYDPAFVEWAHANGFSAEFASVLGLDDSNLDHYLSEYDYNKLWPLNSWSRIWINDKLTLRYTLSDPRFSDYLPKYYYYSTKNGLRVLADNPDPDPSETAFLRVLVQTGEFACKPCNGTGAMGFFKLQFKNGEYRINDKVADSAAIIAFVRQHPNYVFTEYIHPDKAWEAYSPLIHTVRLVVLNEHGSDPRIVGNYIRVPYSSSGASNYIMHDGTNNDLCNLFVSLDLDTGRYDQAVAVDVKSVKKITRHPDTAALLQGTLAHFAELKQLALDISLWYNNLEFIGFDFGVTDHGVKLMEINTHPAIMITQLSRPLCLDPANRAYFERRLHEIDMLSETDKAARNAILR